MYVYKPIIPRGVSLHEACSQEGLALKITVEDLYKLQGNIIHSQNVPTTTEHCEMFQAIIISAWRRLSMEEAKCLEAL